ncbi:tRNA A-37 threonylcarbamoyl transferase component Bud32 [Vreelandella songnenensis]|uniref:tRNA A-37 threonylcarbamoyl transferase component Bud32 n=1 Tax=Vreelandella songnenensis TaxID=1176243 RepID=A0A2T0V3I9_9GAMM|nr:RIO1 family regulatory kinase/ATPase [Halomonas songnenensis]PRY64732.1 tRNA A-37 threonylcarbamoyl transferase component Bud32 [Halomonas songnenensis]
MYDLFLLDTMPKQQATMSAHTLNGERVWLKRAAKRNSHLAYAPLKLLAAWLKLDALKPVPNTGGEQSIITEAQRIEALRRAGIQVPTILAQTPKALLLADAGTSEAPAVTLLDKLKSTDNPEQIDRTLARSIEALNRVHQRDCYLSEAFARNILVTDDKTVFIDFETDPGQVHPPVDCMVRDWYCFIFSLYGKLYKSPTQCERLTPALLEGLRNANQEVRERFCEILPKLLRLQRLPFKFLGSDGRKISVTLQALAVLNKRL